MTIRVQRLVVFLPVEDQVEPAGEKTVILEPCTGQEAVQAEVLALSWADEVEKEETLLPSKK